MKRFYFLKKAGLKTAGLLATIVMVVLIYVLYQSQPPARPPLSPPTTRTEVSNIQAIQTHPETGAVEYELNAQSLTQNSDGTDELHKVIMHWTPTNDLRYTIQASRAAFNRTTGDFVFQEGFTFTRHAYGSYGDLIITGTQLTGNTKSKQITSPDRLDITQDGHQFTAGGMQGDLAVGDYQFTHITIQLTSAPRVDKALF